METEAPPATFEYMQFAVGSRSLGLDLDLCMESLLWTEVSPVPLAPKALIGMISLRSVTIPIIQIDGMVGNKEPRRAHFILISKLGNQVIGIAVNELRSVEISIDDVSLHPERNVYPALEHITLDGVAILHPERLLAVMRKSVRFPL